MNRFKKALYQVPFIKKLYSVLINHHYKRLYENDTKSAAIEFYKSLHQGRIPNLDNPSTFEEKNIWLALNTDTSKWSTLSDKYAVREYINECGLSNILNEIYGKWDKASDINFESLPNEFVIKANNSCGTVLVVKNKSELDINRAKKRIDSWFKGIPYGYIGYNGHYLRIKPCIIAEKLLHDSKSKDLPIDYKFYCSYGKVFACAVMKDRSLNNTHIKHTTFFDDEWNIVYDDKGETTSSIEKPASYNKMVEYCYQLAKEFPLVRVDFYEIDEHPIFGELTFTSSIDVFSEELNRKLGEYIDLSYVRGIKNEQ